MEMDYGFKVSRLSADDGGGFYIEVPDLPGCVSIGENLDEALIKLSDAIESWKIAANATGVAIPEPSSIPADDPSGRFSVRVSRKLHRDLLRIAEEEDQSLNMVVGIFLAQAVAGELIAKNVDKVCGKMREEFDHHIVSFKEAFDWGSSGNKKYTRTVWLEATKTGLPDHRDAA